ncbi:accessory Sec system protein Asp3 [Hutsoniella sourekii]|uniref:accessory Sec system protein Asp3 n=1 Tax=Hutsoniella sourekii TaxID=87650 RepID=UPI0004AD30C8|nr:accessory Sec system protein Asp3 [Hutsoniella sourekii]
MIGKRKTSLLQEIKWHYIKPSTYMHGSQVDFMDSGQVRFENELLPSGKRIHTWTSGSNFFHNRQGSELIQLIPGRHYHLEAHLTCQPKESVFVELSFYDRYDNLIQAVYVKDGQEDFQVPLGTYYYHMSLFSAGCVAFTFNSICLNEEPREERMDVQLFE